MNGLVNRSKPVRRGHKRFIVAMDASAEYVAGDPGGLRAYVESELRKPQVVRGPRGGRYVTTGEIDVLEEAFDPMTGTFRYSARAWAKYVRPTRSVD